jgi:hypothetical protein
MSVIGCRTDDTDLGGIMEDAEGYENLTVFTELKQYLLSDIRKLQEKLKPSKTDRGDCEQNVLHPVLTLLMFASTLCACSGCSNN